jgi:hypothetical protein
MTEWVPVEGQRPDIFVACLGKRRVKGEVVVAVLVLAARARRVVLVPVNDDGTVGKSE